MNDFARRTKVIVKLSGNGVPKEIDSHVLSANFTDNEDDSADDFQVTLEDRTNALTGGWIGERKRFLTATIVQQNWDGKDKKLKCGTFEIDSVDISGPPKIVTIKATSIPYSSTLRMQKKTKAWENVSLKGIASTIASKNGLKLMYESSYNTTYKRKEQVKTSDISFLKKLCNDAGQILKVTSQTIVIYDEESYDKKQEIKTFKFGDKEILSYKFGTSTRDTAYTSCKVSYTDPATKQTITYTYKAPGKGTGQKLEINEAVRSTAEARYLAKKRLRQKNAKEFTARLTVVGDVQLVCGTCVKLKGFGGYDRKYRIISAKHNITGGYTTEIELKQTLEGY